MSGIMEEKAKRLNPFVHDILGVMAENQLTLSDIIYITTTIQMQSIKGIEAQKSPIVSPGAIRVKQ